MILASAHNPDFLEAVLPYVSDPQRASRRIKAESPRLPQPVGPNLPPNCQVGMMDERVVSRDGVGELCAGMVHIDPQQFPRERMQILAVAERISLRARVTHSDVQITVGSKQDATAMMDFRRDIVLHDAA
jgi:hypothetical protein